MMVSLGVSAEPTRNVLLIAIDDLRTELGCYGRDYVDSPHLDALAQQGVLFENHFVQVATCGASRYALLTGRSPARTGVRSGNAGFYRGSSALNSEPQVGAQTLPELFRRNGYHTVCIGKISHTADGRVFAYDGSGDGREELPHAWDELATPLGTWKRGWGVFFAYSGGRHREDGNGHRNLMEFTAQDDEELPDGQMATVAIQHLQELAERGQPFFMGLGFIKPHLPFVAPKQDWEAMASRPIPPPKHAGLTLTRYGHESNEFYKYEMDLTKSRPLSPKDALQARRGYMACVRYTDRQVGRVLRALSSLGLSESTIVVVWGDHGWFLGDTALWGKHSPLERAVRSPLIIRAPGIHRSQRCAAVVESLDLYPTLIELADLNDRKTQFDLDGKSLEPLLTGNAKQIHEVAVSYWRDAVTVRDAQHRLVYRESDDGPRDVELYDIQSDLDPLSNLAEDRPDVVRRLWAAAVARQ